MKVIWKIGGVLGVAMAMVFPLWGATPPARCMVEKLPLAAKSIAAAEILRKVGYYSARIVKRSPIELAVEQGMPVGLVRIELAQYGFNLLTEWQRPRMGLEAVVRQLQDRYPQITQIDQPLSYASIVDACFQAGMHPSAISVVLGISWDSIEDYLVATRQISRFQRRSKWQKILTHEGVVQEAEAWLRQLWNDGTQSFQALEVFFRPLAISETNIRRRAARLGLYVPNTSVVKMPTEWDIEGYGAVKYKGLLVEEAAIRFISDHYGNMSDVQLAEALHVVPHSLMHFRWRHGIIRPEEQTVAFRLSRGFRSEEVQRELITAYQEAKAQGEVLPLYRVPIPKHFLLPSFLRAMRESVIDQCAQVIRQAPKPIPDIQTLFAQPDMPGMARVLGAGSQGHRRHGIFKGSFDFLTHLLPRLRQEEILHQFNPLRLGFKKPYSRKYRKVLQQELITVLIQDYLIPAARASDGKDFVGLNYEQWFGGKGLLPVRVKVYSETTTAEGFVIFDGVEDFYRKLQEEWIQTMGKDPLYFRFSIVAQSFVGTYSPDFRSLVQAEVLKRSIHLLNERRQRGEPVTLIHQDFRRENLLPRFSRVMGQEEYGAGEKFSGRAIFSSRAEYLLALRHAWDAHFQDDLTARLSMRLYQFSIKPEEITPELMEAFRTDALTVFIDLLERRVADGMAPEEILFTRESYRQRGLPDKSRLLGLKQYAPGADYAHQAVFTSPQAFFAAARSLWLARHPDDAYTHILGRDGEILGVGGE